MKNFSFFGQRKKEEITQRAQFTTDYEVGKYKLVLKDSHMLAKYQAQYPLYDRFLPYFCGFFNGLIIDVGANIGDTSIAIFSRNDDCFVVGVEPDEEFYKECVESVVMNNLSDRFLGVQKFISTRKGAFVIEKDQTSSTGSINLSSTENTDNTISFKDLLSEIPKNLSENFDVLKIDTDGFDWDVINSFSELGKDFEYLPRFVFFEMQTFLNNDSGKTLQRTEMNNNYLEALSRLKDLGYTTFSLFDNFGTYVKTTDSIEEIKELNEYVIRSQVLNRHSTIFYFDVLAYHERELKFTSDKIADFYSMK